MGYLCTHSRQSWAKPAPKASSSDLPHRELPSPWASRSAQGEDYAGTGMPAGLKRNVDVDVAKTLLVSPQGSCTPIVVF